MESSEHLTIYLDRIHSFLISNDDTLVFPTLTMSFEDILANIAKDSNFLKQSIFGEDCKNLVAKLTAVLDKNKDIFTLGHEFKFDDKRKKVMVYKKIPVHAFQEAISVPSKPLRKPNFIKEKTEDNKPTVMSSFKITFLNATLKFVKNEAQMVLSYPNMSSEQAVFVKQMIDQCMERNGTKAGFKGLYDPLAEALKIFSLKYDFNLYVGTLGEMKKLRFEKTSKITDTSRREGTSIIYEETTDSDSSHKQVGISRSQKKLTKIIDVMTQITAEFKLRVLTELKNFLTDKNTITHTFSNLTIHEQQFISHWQALAQRVEVIKLLDVQGQMVLDVIREFLKKKNFRVKVELGMSLSDRFAKLTKVFSPNVVKLTEEQKIARLKAMVLPTQTRRALAAGNSSSNSSSDTNAGPQNKFEKKVAKFFRKTKGVKNDWIQATLTRLKDFLQDEAEASLIIRSITELQIAFLSKWQNLLSEAEVISTYPTDVQMLMREVRDVAAANKKKFRVEFNLTKYKTGLRDARFTKLPAFYTPPNQILKENNAVNILPKNKDNKTENVSDTDAKVNITSKKNILGNVQPKNKKNKTESSSDSASSVNKISKMNIQPLNKENKTGNSSDSASSVNKISIKNIQPKNKENKTGNSSDSASSVNKLSKKNVLFNIPPKSKKNKTENGITSIKNESGKKQTTTAVKLDPQKGGKSDISSGKAFVPINTKLAAKFEPNGDTNKGEQKVVVPKATNLANKIEPKNERNKVDNSSEKIAASKTTKIPPTENYEAKEISKKVETSAAAIKKKNLAAPVKFEPKQSDDKDGNTPANATKARSPGAIHKSISLTSLNRKDRSAKNASKVVRLPAATVKLIEGLNQPLVSERGLKMMRQMGWEGGPLGLRGEGIAEPIMPELALGKRAGLGAPKTNLQELIAASKSTDGHNVREGVVNSRDDNFKKDIIQTLLRMVKGDASQKTELKFNHALTVPDWDYVNTVATNFNNREGHPEGMLTVLARVSDHELMLTAAWSCSKTEILLILSKYNEELKINQKWSRVALPKERLCKRSERKLVEVSAAREVAQRVMVAGQAFKYYVMAQILDFCLNCHAESPLIKEVTKDIVLKGTMVKKQRSYVNDLVVRVNCGARSSTDFAQEVALHDEIVTAIHGKGYRVTVNLPPIAEKSGELVYNIISLTKTYGYRAKTVLIKLPSAKTEATTTNSCITKDNNSLQDYVDIIEKNVQELTKPELRHVTKTTQDQDVANKENNIQNKVQTVNIIENKVKSPAVSIINTKPNNKKVDETITILTNNIKINSQSETENTHKNKETAKDGQQAMDNNQTKEVDEKKVSAEYIQNTDRRQGTEKNGHENNKAKNDETKTNDKQNNQTIQLTSTESKSVKYNIVDRDLSTIDDEKKENNESDKASRLLKSIENAALKAAKVDITNDKSSKTESETTALAIQIKTDSNESDKTLLIDSIDTIASKICNVTITDENSKTEKPVVLCQIHKEIDRSEVEEKIPPLNDIIASLVEINITENTKSGKVINDSKDVPTVSHIEVNRESNKKDQTLKRLSKRTRSKAVSSNRAHKRTKYDYVKHINIKPKNYPQSKITNNMAAEIQKSIRQSIDYTQVLPLLKCHGIQDGVLSYSCHNEKSLEIIQNVLKKFDFDVKLTEESEKETCKMSLRLNTFIDESVESIFNNIETFNLGLSTKDWVFIKKEQYSDFLVIFVDLDLESYKFIRGENFKLYAGIDEAQFSIVWG